MYIVINGGGKVASHLARMMLEHGHEVALIERRDEVVEKLVAELPQRGAHHPWRRLRLDVSRRMRASRGPMCSWRRPATTTTTWSRASWPRWPLACRGRSRG